MLQPAYFKNNKKKSECTTHNGKYCSSMHMLSFDISAFFTWVITKKFHSALQRNYQIIISKKLLGVLPLFK